MTLSLQDAQAINTTAGRLGVDPRVLGGLMELESGVNPNIWGGAGGQYRGLIQFGPGARKEVGLPDGPMTIAEQMPYVEKYFQQRGFTPGKHGPTELYRTVLVGNPGQSGTDSFGTNSDAAAKRMMPGGDLYQRFAKRFDPVAGKLGGASSGASGAISDVMSAADTTDDGMQALQGLLKPRGGLGDLELGARGTPGMGQTLAAGSMDAITPLLAVLPALAGNTPASRRMAGDVLTALQQSQQIAQAEQFLVQTHRGVAGKLMPAGLQPLIGAAPSAQGSSGLNGLWREILGGTAEQPAAPSAPASAATTATGSLDDGEELPIVALGKKLQAKGFKVAEHPDFGGVGKHSERSHHYAGNALDITIQPGSPLLKGRPDSDWTALTKEYGRRLKEAIPGAEIFHPGDDPVGGHDSHIHLALPSGTTRLNPRLKQLLFG